jgi:CheY-like chemotaxis protein
MASCISGPATTPVALAKVLIADDDPASRLALQTVLRAGGYNVEAAASAAEAIQKLDEQEYQLVLTDLRMESPEAGLRVLAHARILAYKPATALISASIDRPAAGVDSLEDALVISSDDVPELLTQVADLIGARAKKRVARSRTARGR